jgi:hypothetical protein
MIPSEVKVEDMAEMVDSLNIQLMRVGVIMEAIELLAEEGRDRKRICTLADMADEECQKVRQELNA